MWKMISIADRQAKKTLLGAVMIKFATGLATIWTSCNIYFVSQLKHQGYHPDHSTYSVIFLSAIIPTCFAVLLSMPLCKYFGYKQTIRASAFMFLLGPLAINFTFNLYTFTIFWLIIPLSCLCIGGIPILNCLWNHFNRNLSKVTALVIVSFSMGNIFWNLLFMFIVNPNNQKAEIDQNNIPIFPTHICDRLFFASNIAYVTAGTFYILGSFMITIKPSTITNNNQQNQIILDGQGNLDLLGVQRAIQKISDSQVRKSQKMLTLFDALFDKKFILVFLILGSVPLYLVYVTLNIKLLYMPIINDDHFLSYCSAIVTLSALIGAPFWGYICDLKGFQYTILLLIFIDTIIKIFGIFCEEKWSLVLMFLCLGINDKGLHTIVGPGLVSMFGIDLATQLIAYKGLAIVMCYFLAPVLQIFLYQRLDLSRMLLLLTGFSFFGIFLSLYLKFRVKYKCQAQGSEYELSLIKGDTKS